jgi:putative peptidoglycan lipid II flippase
VLTVIWGDGKAASLVQLVVGALVLSAAYLGAAVALRIREVSQVAAMVRGRLGR